MHAKDLFRILLREQLGPRLRAEGFRGSGQSWRLEHPSGNAALIYVARNRGNTADRLRFSIGLAVASKVVWDWQATREPWRATAKPSAQYANDNLLSLSVGALLPQGEARYWTVTSGMRLAPLAASLTEVLCGRAIPLLRDHLTDAALCRWLQAHDPRRGWPTDTWQLIYLSVLLAAQGPSSRLDQVLAQLQARAGQDPRPPWLAEHVTDMRQRAVTAAAGARAEQPPSSTTRPDAAT